MKHNERHVSWFFLLEMYDEERQDEDNEKKCTRMVEEVMKKKIPA